MSEKVKVLGVEYDRLDLEGLVRVCMASIERNEKNIILNHNMHSVYLYHHDPTFSDCFKHSQFIHADGMPLILWARLLGRKNISRDYRITYVDLLPKLCKKLNEEEKKLFFLGGPPDFGPKAAAYFAKNYPNIQFEYAHGYFDATKNSNDSKRIIEEMNRFSSNVVLVGMGMPRQEKWIIDHCDQISTNVFLAGGACLEYFTGTVSKPPRWVGQFSLEWLFRLVESPKRYYYRYLIEPIFLIPKFLKDVFTR
jgi:N-acetylglucosaminyldiphosphoundecaprenol N-acetyl-beta-D-mannosaminyltransferase